MESAGQRSGNLTPKQMLWCLMFSPRRVQQRRSPQYGLAIEQIELVRPNEAAVVRDYVASLRAEAASSRVRASLLESQLQALSGWEPR